MNSPSLRRDYEEKERLYQSENSLGDWKQTVVHIRNHPSSTNKLVFDASFFRFSCRDIVLIRVSLIGLLVC